MNLLFILYDPLEHILNHQALKRTQMSYMPLMNCGTNLLNTLYMLNNSFVCAESVLACPQKQTKKKKKKKTTNKQKNKNKKQKNTKKKHTHTKETKKESINAF